MTQSPTFLVLLLASASILVSGCSSFPIFGGDSDDPIQKAQERRERYQSQLNEAREQQEVVLGMPMRDVQAVWGSPLEVEKAGDGSRGNERWIYREGFSGVGLQSSRVLYFEQGRLAGWQTVSNP